jgi:hypothetical protein
MVPPITADGHVAVIGGTRSGPPPPKVPAGSVNLARRAGRRSRMVCRDRYGTEEGESAPGVTRAAHGRPRDASGSHASTSWIAVSHSPHSCSPGPNDVVTSIPWSPAASTNLRLASITGSPVPQAT